MNTREIYKPNALVRVRVKSDGVEGGERTYIGECVSYPFPDGYVSVRRVPGHPGTLEQVSILDLSIPSCKFRTVHYATIAPIDSNDILPFPEDMLRRCNAAPVNFDLVNGRARLCTDLYGDALWIAKAGASMRDAFWHDDRWKSFSWSIVPQKSEAI